MQSIMYVRDFCLPQVYITIFSDLSKRYWLKWTTHRFHFKMSEQKLFLKWLISEYFDIALWGSLQESNVSNGQTRCEVTKSFCFILFLNTLIASSRYILPWTWNSHNICDYYYLLMVESPKVFHGARSWKRKLKIF